GTIFHIRDWSFVPIEQFGCWRLPGDDFNLTQEELSWQYAPPVAEMCTLQSQQADALEWLFRLGMRSLWYEGLTERSFALYHVNALRLPNIKTIRQLRIGAPARLFPEHHLRVLPLDDEETLARMAAGESTEALREEREDAMVRRLLAAPHKVATVVLSGDHALRDNLDRLGGERWQLVTIDLEAYDRLVNGRSQPSD
ncbi:MAG TPA: hypothetical protein VHB77_14835, partial [Planctomycetaceae bacterium]|nr:hypothetical protein [Planctomycetaceae bacterium]